jgi:MFS family permease
MVYLALAIPLGKLADKRGRSVIFVVGHLAAAGSYLLLLSDLPRLVMIGLVLAMLGVYYAATDGVLSALVSPLVPAGARSTALSLVQTAVAVGRMVAAIGFGFVWSSVGQHTALAIYGFALIAMIVVIAPMLRGLNKPAAKGAPVATAV